MIVRVELIVSSAGGVTADGLRLYVTPSMAGETVKVTRLLKPFNEAIIMFAVSEVPR